MAPGIIEQVAERFGCCVRVELDAPGNLGLDRQPALDNGELAGPFDLQLTEFPHVHRLRPELLTLVQPGCPEQGGRKSAEPAGFAGEIPQQTLLGWG